MWIESKKVSLLQSIPPLAGLAKTRVLGVTYYNLRKAYLGLKMRGGIRGGVVNAGWAV